MNIHNLISLAICCFMTLLSASAPADEEQDLIVVLQSAAGVVQKCDACRKLKMAGTIKAVPVLSGLLGEERVFHAACHALEGIPEPEAGNALREALGKTSGLTQATIVSSIGRRGDREAVPELAKLLANADLQVVSAAVIALGRIAGNDAAAALRKTRAKAPESLQADLVDGLLMCAERMRSEGDDKAASLIYNEIYESSPSDQCKTAAYRGLVLSSGDGAGALIAKALMSNDRNGHRAVLPLLREVKGESVTKEVAVLLRKVPANMQIAIIEDLSQRGDPAAVADIIEVLKCDSPEVRLAALTSLAVLGDASVAPVLAEAASKRPGREQDVARESLNQLSDPMVCENLMRCLTDASPAMQSEIVRALGMRRETRAVPALLKMAGEGGGATRVVALKSLTMLGDGKIAGDLVKLLLKAGTDAERDAVEQALSAVCLRSEKPFAFVSQMLDSMNGADVPVRVALLRAAGRIGGSDALKALREGVVDKEELVRDAALRTMAEYGGIELAPDLLRLAGEKEPLSRHVLALRGYWRVVASETSACSADERVKMCEAGIAAAQRPEEKKLGLTELAKLVNPAALKLARTLCADESVRDEAETACVRISAGLLGSHPDEAKLALQQLAASSRNEAVRAEAKKAMGTTDQHAGYITAWLAAGPYRQQGKQCQELFDIPFAPEQGSGEVKWQAVPKPVEVSKSLQIDLLGICGGDQCVVYIKTRVSSPKEQKVQVEIGSDDGFKIWINGKQAGANNVMRAVAPGNDKVEAMLKEGWNDVLMKITQNNMGCGVCVRVLNSDGSVVEGLRCETGK